DFGLLLLPTHNDLFPLAVLVTARGNLLGLGAGPELFAGGRLDSALIVVERRGLLEILDAPTQRVTDARQLVGAEHDEDDEQDDDELAHSGHGRSPLASLNVAETRA